MSSRDPVPWTVGDLARPLEADPGREVHFCPILGLPIVPALRVRALPGFHVLSLDAGKEALARGSYVAFGEKFPCHNLEYLHPDDKVFVCAEDNKVFLNEMSMRYHRYIGHELTVRKDERKRLRDRAEELKVRRGMQRQHAASAQVHAQAMPAPATLPSPRQPRALPVVRTSAPAPADSYRTVSEDPYVVSASAPVDPYLGGVDATATSTPVAAGEPADATLGVVVASGSPAQAETAAATSLLAGGEAAAAAAAVVAATTATVAPVATQPLAGGDDGDLYGDMGDAKRQKSSSTYATAIGAIFGNDFDEDD